MKVTEIKRELLNYNESLHKGYTYYDKLILYNPEKVITETVKWDVSKFAGDFAFEWDTDGSERKTYLESLPQYIKDGFNYLITEHKEYTPEEYHAQHQRSMQNQIDFGEIDLWQMKSR